MLSRHSNKEILPIGSTISEKQILYDYFLELSRRSKLKIQDITELSKEIGFDQYHSIILGNDESNYYGSFYTLQLYANIQPLNLPPPDLSIQHGIVYEALAWERNKVDCLNFVWSSKIKDILKNQVGAKKVIAIGAPFFYAKSILSSEQIKKEKNRLGKNLLAFPMHSTHYINTIYNVQNFVEILKEQRSQFETVRVCLYWKDIQNGIAKKYEAEGFECVCCGHIFDIFFLQRLRSLLEIADATISNGVGSHIGYSIYLNKPHNLVPDKFQLIDIQGSEGEEEMLCKEQSKNYWQIYNAFALNDSFEITAEQKQIVDDFWGMSEIKEPSEIRRIIEDSYSIR